MPTIDDSFRRIEKIIGKKIGDVLNQENLDLWIVWDTTSGDRSKEYKVWARHTTQLLKDVNPKLFRDDIKWLLQDISYIYANF